MADFVRFMCENVQMSLRKTKKNITMAENAFYRSYIDVPVTFIL
jgi:hypothetical protein